MGTILATGGAGFIGSHVTVALIEAGHEVLILDDLSNSSEAALSRLGAICGRSIQFIRGDVRDGPLLEDIFSRQAIDAVVHLAGLKSVGQSVEQPILYYNQNLVGALSLLDAMMRHRVRRLVFSSSATVYGVPERIPVPETACVGATNPYGRTKLQIEQIIDDVVAAAPDIAAISLRYFNPVGAHPSGLIGEEPTGIPNNLFPYIAMTAAGILDCVRIFGNDYPTPDGTGIRDYVHVMDMAEGHGAALTYLLEGNGKGENRKINLGCGRGFSVLEALEAFERAAGRRIPREIVARRPGDVAEVVADPALAERILGWRARRGLDLMCSDHWAFQIRRMMPTEP
jgi:UDP-glucose 4-epimerase